jgi:guanylate kinase
MERAKEELTASGEFNYTLINDDPNETLQKFESLIFAV